MFVSPVTLKTVRIFSGTSGRLVNHSASAHDCITRFADAFPAFAFSSTSWNASNIRMVLQSASAAISASFGSSSASMSGWML